MRKSSGLYRPVARRYFTFPTIVVVFPVPAPAMTKWFRIGLTIHSICCSSSSRPSTFPIFFLATWISRFATLLLCSSIRVSRPARNAISSFLFFLNLLFENTGIGEKPETVSLIVLPEAFIRSLELLSTKSVLSANDLMVYSKYLSTSIHRFSHVFLFSAILSCILLINPNVLAPYS